MNLLRALLTFESLAFGVASVIHRGLVFEGYADPGASTAEGIIAIVLALGLVATFAVPRWARVAGLVAQAFGILGTSIGLFLLTRGLAPNTVPDVIFHIGIYAVLWIGLVVAWRHPSRAEGQ